MYEKNLIHIACGLDSKYTRFASVLLVSIFENNKDESFMCHVMGLELKPEDKADLSNLANCYDNQIRFYDMNAEDFSNFNVTRQWNIVVYFRLVLPNLLDRSIKRIIYFDCDIICRGSIRQLYDTFLGGGIYHWSL